MPGDNLTASVKRMLRRMAFTQTRSYGDAKKLARMIRDEEVPIERGTLIVVNYEVKSWVSSDRELAIEIERLTGQKLSTVKEKRRTGTLKQQILKGLENSNQASQSARKKADKIKRLVDNQQVTLNLQSFHRIFRAHKWFEVSWLKYAKEIERLKMRRRQGH